MREICTSGSEGGRAQTNELSLPLSFNLAPSLLQVHRVLPSGNDLRKVGGTSGAESGSELPHPPEFEGDILVREKAPEGFVVDALLPGVSFWKGILFRRGFIVDGPDDSLLL